MKKTVSINISGFIFHIDEDAYAKLSDYLSAIKKQFGNTEEREEILQDIQARIAEIFKERLGEDREVVSMDDVEELFSIMGTPDDYITEEEGEPVKEDSDSFEQSRKADKRIYRDKDNALIGGVCSGFGAYFRIDPLWIRLVLVAAFIAGGTGLILYLLLWAIIPAAETRTEKMQMKGENITLNNIQDKVKEMANEARNINSKPYADKARQTVSNLGVGLGKLFGVLGKALGKLFGLFFSVAGLVLLTIVGIMIFKFETGGLDIDNNGPAFFIPTRELALLLDVSPTDVSMFLFGLSIICLIPLIGLTYGGIRLLFNIEHKPRVFGISLTSIWLIGVVLSGASAVFLFQSHGASGQIKSEFNIQIPEERKFFLKVGEEYTLYDRWHYNRAEDWYENLDKLKVEDSLIVFEYPHLVNIRESLDGKAKVIVEYKSRGRDNKVAKNFAGEINYNLNQIDSIIVFDSYFTTSLENKFRGQEVRIELVVPQGTIINFDRSLKGFIYDIDNYSDTYDGRMIGKDWVMTDKGLMCLDCKSAREEKRGITTEEYKEKYNSKNLTNDSYNNSKTDSLNIQTESL